MMQEKLINTIKKAYTKVPLYMRLAENNNIDIDTIEEITKLPLIEKNMYIKDIESGISSEYILNYMRGKLMYIDTSGSTGKCLRTFWTKSDTNASMLPLWIARKKRFNISSASKMCYFYSVTGNISEHKEKGVFYQKTDTTLGFKKLNLTPKKMIIIYNMIKEFNPEWMFLQTSMAMLFVNILKREGLKKPDSLRYIELTGEILKDYERQNIKEFFGCNVANQYGCNEVNSIAYECREGNLHCMTSNVYVEIISDNKNVGYGVEGDIYITSLNNQVMPFVRYGTGDRGKLIKGTVCRCGNCNPILILENARKNDYIKYIDGTKSTSEVFVNVFFRINEENIFVNQFQVVQRDYDDFLVRIVLNNDNVVDEEMDESDIEEMFFDNLEEEKLLLASFEFEFRTELYPDNSTGKLKYFVCEI